MAAIERSGAMTRSFAAAVGGRGNVTAAKITPSEEFYQASGPSGLQAFELSGMRTSVLSVSIRAESCSPKRKPHNPKFYVAHSRTSRRFRHNYDRMNLVLR